MAGPSGKGVCKGTRRSKRLAQLRPEATEPRARRTRGAESPVPPHEASDAEAIRSPSPPCESDSANVTSRDVLPDRETIVPATSNPTRRRYQKGKRSKLAWQTPTCARLGLEHYNSTNQGDEHEMVKSVNSNAFVFNGVWMHANFLAKRKCPTSCVDLAPKYFFAEVKSALGVISCVSCIKLDPGHPENNGDCEICPPQILHPAGGGYLGAPS